MVIFNLVINSKNKVFLNNFILFFNNYLFYNPIILVKYLQKKVGIKVITLLRSPHVNKKSQEQFKNQNFKYFLKIKAQRNLKFLLFLKRLSHKVFSNINFKIKQSLNNKSFFKEHFNIINLSNFNIGMLVKLTTIKNFKLKIKLNFLKKNIVISYVVSKKANQLFTILQLYCEFFKIKQCLNSSVGLEQRTENSCVSSSRLLLNKQMQNYLSNTCTSLQNGQMARLSFIVKPRKKTCENFLKILWKEGYILGYQILNTDYKKFKIFLKYKNNTSVINNIKKISNPGNKIFYCAKNSWKVVDNNSLIVISTSKGVKSITKSKKFKIGGQPFILIN